MPIRPWPAPHILLGLIVLCSACTGFSRTASDLLTVQVDTSYGYLIVEPRAEARWPFTRGDTLAERRRDNVPRSVRQTAEAVIAKHLKWAAPCYRFFERGGRYMALVDVSCPYNGSYDDGQLLVLIPHTHEAFFPPWDMGGWERVCPAQRDRMGREVRTRFWADRCMHAPASPAPDLPWFTQLDLSPDGFATDGSGVPD